VIQQSLRSGLKKDVTVITIAHRLQTIMDADKIVSVFSIHCDERSLIIGYDCRWFLMPAEW